MQRFSSDALRRLTAYRAASSPLNREAIHAWMLAVGMIKDHEPQCFRYAEVRGQARMAEEVSAVPPFSWDIRSGKRPSRHFKQTTLMMPCGSTLAEALTPYTSTSLASPSSRASSGIASSRTDGSQRDHSTHPHKRRRDHHPRPYQRRDGRCFSGSAQPFIGG